MQFAAVVRLEPQWINSRIVIALLCAMLLSLSACGVPVPSEKSAYVGEWSAPGMSLLIMQDGSVSYRRIKRGVTTTINGPLQKFKGDNFIVGVGLLTTTFVVTQPPRQADAGWKMVVDGVELTRATLILQGQREI